MPSVDILVPAYAVWPVSRYELELVIAQSDPSRELIVVSCDGTLSFCPVRDLDKNFSCGECQKFRAKQLKIFKTLSKYSRVRDFKLSAHVQDATKTTSSVVDKDKKIYSTSTLMTAFKTKNATQDHPWLYSQVSKDYDFSYSLAAHFLERCNVNNFIIFNARISFFRAFLKAATQNFTNALVYEVPMIGKSNFIVTENYSIVDRNKWSTDLLKFSLLFKHSISRAEYLEESQKSQTWFNNRANFINSEKTGSFDNKPYLQVDVKNKLPDLVNSYTDLQLVTYFVSSDFELVGIPELENAFEIDQFQLVSLLTEWATEEKFKLIIRLHPNMKNSPLDELKEYENMSFSSNLVEVVMPLDKVDSYRLAQSSDYVVSFGSTIGLEAAFLGAHSIVCGASHYSAFNVGKHVSTVLELKQLLNQGRQNETDLPVIQSRCLDMIIALKHFSRKVHYTFNYNNIVFYRKGWHLGWMMPSGSIIKKLLRKIDRRNINHET